MKIETYNKMASLAREYYKKAGIIVREDEEIEVADFGLGMIEKIGLRKYRFTLSEGKKREIRRMIKFANAQVLRLIRIQIGNYVLPADLLEGNFRILTPQEVEFLQKNGK